MGRRSMVAGVGGQTARMDPTIAANRASWNASSRAYQAAHDPVIGRAPKLWGVHALPETVLHAVGDVDGLTVLEFGCGAAQWASSLARDGAAVVGIDVSEVQLDAARAKDQRLPLVQAAGQMIPLRSRSFDLVFCDHGAMSWADPYVTVPEVTRVLKVGGRLVFNVASPFLEVCWDDTLDAVGTQLRQDYFGMHRTVEDNGATSFTLGYGDWIRLFSANHLVVDDLIEPRPADASPNTYWPSEPADWFTRWPGECIWVTRFRDA